MDKFEKESKNSNSVHGEEEEISMDRYLQIRKLAALTIDPKSAEVAWFWGETLDPYGIDPELPEKLRQIGRLYFARSPGSDIWVSFYDLPDLVRERLWEMHC